MWSSLNKPNRDWCAVRCSEKNHHCLNPEAEFFPHENVTILAPGVFSHTVDVPKSGHYSAFFIEAREYSDIKQDVRTYPFFYTVAL